MIQRKLPRSRRTVLRLRSQETLEPRCLLAADPVITEFMASNQEALVDAGDKTPDWLEIHNVGDESVDLTGWFLSDDPAALTKWQFPSAEASMLDADEYLVVRASDEDRVDEVGNLHTNFKLSASGDYLALVSPDGEVVSEFGTDGSDYPEQFEDVSYGISVTGTVGYFRESTPGEVNPIAVDGFVADTTFSVDRGFFDQPFTVEVASQTVGATLVYTTDGSEPTLRNGTAVMAMADASPSASVRIETTTTLRAAAFKEDYEPTNVDTQTYLFLSDVIEQPSRPEGFPAQWGGAPAVDYEMDPLVVNDSDYTEDLLSGLRELPSLSLVSDVDLLFGSGGIYSNTQNGNLEVPASVEWIQPDDDTEFQIDAGLKLSGGASRSPNNSPKHSLNLRFRTEYGAGRLNHDLFEDSPVDSFNSLQLRAVYNNSWIHWSSEQQARGTLIRDQFVRDSLIAMGQDDAGRGTYAHLYLNGLYWGVYNIHERPDSAHYAEYHGGDADDYDARNGTNTIDGTSASFTRLKRTIAGTSDWSEVEAILDVNNYIDWTIINAYVGNDDLKLDSNWRAAGGGTADGKWRFYAWDSERSLESVLQSPQAMLDPMEIREDLLAFPEFRLAFGDRVEKHFGPGGALTPENVAERWNMRVEELQNAIVAESARWGDYRRDVHRRGDDIELYLRDTHWLPEHERLNEDYFPLRSERVVSRLQRTDWLPELDPPAFLVNGEEQQGGEFSAGLDQIGFEAGEESPFVIESMVVIDQEAPVLAFVPEDDSFEDGDQPWYHPEFDTDGWISGTNGVGYDRASSGAYVDLIGTDIETPWLEHRSSVYARLEFNLEDGFQDYDRMQLNMFFDDGFTAYLNGDFIDVDRGGNRNQSPTRPDWDASSTGDDRPDDVVLQSAVEFDLTHYIDQLVPGRNVLAIHGLNDSPNSSDMLFLGELLLQKTELSKPAVYYTLDGSDPRGVDGQARGTLFDESIPLAQSGTVRARALAGDEWSALVEANFIVGALPGDINLDGRVDFQDFLVLSTNFGREVQDDPIPGDLDADGMVNFTDFLILSENFGRTRE